LVVLAFGGAGFWWCCVLVVLASDRAAPCQREVTPIRENTVVTPELLARELLAAGIAEVDASTRRRAEYSSDASNYRVVPNAVVFPRHADEVALALSVARATGAPITARGAGTSCAGNAVGSGIVLDFSRHLNRIVSMDAEGHSAVVEPGVILADLQRAAAPHGLRFGPDPSTQARCTIGGMIGNNACGAHALAYGRTSDNVTELALLLADGRSLQASTLQTLADPIGAELSALVQANLGVIRTEFGRFSRQVSGYSLEHLLLENGGRLARFLTGTEGSLALITAATVRLVEVAPFTALAVLAYPDMAAAADAVPALLPLKPLALEGMDARLVDVLRDRRGPSAVPPLPQGGGWLFVETGGATQSEARAAADEIVRAAEPQASSVVAGEDARRLWRIREDGAGLGGRTPAGAPAWPGWEDAAVPPENLGNYLREFTVLMAEHGVDGLAYGHFGDGCVHVRLDFPLASRPSVLRSFLLDAAALAAAHGGSMSGEHGDGRARGELLPAMYSPDAIKIFSQVKAIFDPANLLNPGIVVDPAPVDADLRLPLAKSLSSGLGFSYPHDGGSLTAAVHRCVGVGKCRADTTPTGGVMCPSYLATRDETHSTRGRARVLQEMANGTLVTGGWKSPEVAEALDLCLSCKACSADCPAGVDMATYKAEALYQRYRRRLRPASHYALGWLPRWTRIASRAPRLANAAMRPKPLAALAKRLGGIDQRRPLPEFAAQSFRAWFRSRPVTSSEPVMLWVDTFTNGFSPEVGKAAVEILESAGFSVQIPQEEVCCGLTWISTGQLDGARKQLRRTLDSLEPAIEAGIPVVGLEPSCAAVFRSDLCELLPYDDRAGRLKELTKTLAELLTEREWTPPSLAGIQAVVQPHCHQHAVMGFAADLGLLERAGVTVNTVGGCCGLAGNFGVEQGHYEVSVAVAEHSLLPAVRQAGPDTVVLADGFSCRTQLDQLAGRAGQHLAQLLAAHLAKPSGNTTADAVSKSGNTTADTVSKSGNSTTDTVSKSSTDFGSDAGPGTPIQE
jgi:FAD/FMN-containing dehydrogenase/Fe-S oxidoreductase